MPEKPRARASSATRSRAPRLRRSSLDNHHQVTHSGQSVVLSGVDLRTTKQKIEDVEQEIQEDQTPDQHLNCLVLLQLYRQLEYGDCSAENARSYLNLSKFYFKRKSNFLYQAKIHALNAREILDQLPPPSDIEHLDRSQLSFDIYLQLIKCSLNAKKVQQRETKTKNKFLLSIDTKHIGHDLKLLEKFLQQIKPLMSTKDYHRYDREYIFVKFENIVNDGKQFDPSIYEVLEMLLVTEPEKRQIELLTRCATYLCNFERKQANRALTYANQAVQLAEEQENQSTLLAQTLVQRCQVQNRSDHLTDQTEKDFLRAMKLYQGMSKNLYTLLNEFANYYIKLEKYQDALNILCEHLPQIFEFFGDYSEEVIQAESQIGAIYLREGECLNAAEHLKTCLDLQEVVYGAKDARTSQTRHTVEILKKDPMVCRTFFARDQDGSRPAFRASNRVSHEREDLQLFQTVTRKPPIGSKSSFGGNK